MIGRDLVVVLFALTASGCELEVPLGPEVDATADGDGGPAADGGSDDADDGGPAFDAVDLDGVADDAGID